MQKLREGEEKLFRASRQKHTSARIWWQRAGIAKQGGWARADNSNFANSCGWEHVPWDWCVELERRKGECYCLPPATRTAKGSAPSVARVLFPPTLS